jgi:hypothetical protein
MSSVFISSVTISASDSFQCHLPLGKSGLTFLITFIILGITSPLRIISINAPLPRPLSTTNLALLAVTRFISTPPTQTGSIKTIGFK